MINLPIPSKKTLKQKLSLKHNTKYKYNFKILDQEFFTQSKTTFLDINKIEKRFKIKILI